MGLGIGDLNRDGVWDLLVPALGKNFMMVSDLSSSSWFDGASFLGLQPDDDLNQNSGWGGEICDLDNDGYLDVLMGYGTVRLKSFDEVKPRHEWEQPDEVYRGRPSGGFEPVGARWGVDDVMVTRGSVVADLNRDGYLDIIKREYGGVVVIHLSRCGEDAWLEVDLDWDSPNRHGVGAEVLVEADGLWHRRLISAGSTSTTSGGPPIAHVGLGEAQAVSELMVRWPDGLHESFTVDGGMPTHQRVTVRRPSP